MQFSKEFRQNNARLDQKFACKNGEIPNATERVMGSAMVIQAIHGRPASQK
jgi:hypothetical protein